MSPTRRPLPLPCHRPLILRNPILARRISRARGIRYVSSAIPTDLLGATYECINVCDLSGELCGPEGGEGGVVQGGQAEEAGMRACLPRMFSASCSDAGDDRLTRMGPPAMIADIQMDCIDEWLLKGSGICPACNQPVAVPPTPTPATPGVGSAEGSRSREASGQSSAFNMLQGERRRSSAMSLLKLGTRS